MADINQKNYSNRFVNPYNFIHLPEKKAMAYGETDRHTGVIHYTITTKTASVCSEFKFGDCF